MEWVVLQQRNTILIDCNLQKEAYFFAKIHWISSYTKIIMVKSMALHDEYSISLTANETSNWKRRYISKKLLKDILPSLNH
jgi:hypothetical protein